MKEPVSEKKKKAQVQQEVESAAQEVGQAIEQELAQGEELSVAIEAAEGECCDRCWNYRTTVGEYNGHAHICKRCADAL